MMKSLYGSRKLVLTGSSTTLLRFFFNARGSETERSWTALYRTLLCNFLQESPLLMCELLPQFLEKEVRQESARWQTIDLADIFHHSIEQYDANDIEILIDALDECSDTQVAEVVRRFERSIQTPRRRTKLRVCWSSRYYPHISLRSAKGIELVLNENNGGDIERYVHSVFPAGPQNLLDSVKFKIMARANGVFLWASLVTDRLLKAFDSGSTASELEEMLLSTPDDLDDLYYAIFRDSAFTKAQREYLQRIALFVLGSFRSLSLQELYTALSLGSDNSNWSLHDVDLNPTEADQFAKRINHASGGLIEVAVRDQPGDEPGDKSEADVVVVPATVKATIVQVIHESVREFLWGKGLPLVQAASKASLLRRCHSEITRACFNGLSKISDLATDKCYEPLDQLAATSPRLRLSIPLNPSLFPSDTFLMDYIRHNVFLHLKVTLELSNSETEIGFFSPSAEARQDALCACLRIFLHYVEHRGGIEFTTPHHIQTILGSPEMFDLSSQDLSKLLEVSWRLAASSEILRREGVRLFPWSP